MAEEPGERTASTQTVSRVGKLLGGESILKSFAACTKVEAFRLESFMATARRERHGEDTSKEPRFCEQIIRGGPIALNENLSRKTVSLLLDATAYRDRKNECEPEPGVGLRFTHDNDTWEVLVCLECDVIMAKHNDQRGEVIEFEPAHQRFIGVAKEIFPEDAEIQKLD
jgi:hypothetical protein